MNKHAEPFLLEADQAYADYLRNTRARIDADGEAQRQRQGARVGISRVHESAHLHVAGQAPYIDDLPERAGALPGVVDVIVAAAIPGVNECGAIVHDAPILADGEVHYLGQPVFAVIAND